MKKTFTFEFEDESKDSTISFEYDHDVEEKISLSHENGETVLYANSQSYLLLAKIFTKLALCDYEDGFHVHINSDFDSEKPKILRIVLVS